MSMGKLKNKDIRLVHAGREKRQHGTSNGTRAMGEGESRPKYVPPTCPNHMRFTLCLRICMKYI